MKLGKHVPRRSMTATDFGLGRQFEDQKESLGADWSEVQTAVGMGPPRQDAGDHRALRRTAYLL